MIVPSPFEEHPDRRESIGGEGGAPTQLLENYERSLKHLSNQLKEAEQYNLDLQKYVNITKQQSTLQC